MLYRATPEQVSKAGGWYSGHVGKQVYGSGLDQQVVCATHGFDEATCGSKLWYYPFHKLLDPPENVLRHIYPRVLDVSEDSSAPEVLDIVEASAWVQEFEVRLCCAYMYPRDLW